MSRASTGDHVQQLRMSIFRGDASEGEMITYDVPVREGMVVLDAVLWVQANLAPDLAVRWNCKAAKCGSCSAEINGFPRLMCKSPVSDYGAELSVRPVEPHDAWQRQLFQPVRQGQLVDQVASLDGLQEQLAHAVRLGDQSPADTAIAKVCRGDTRFKQQG